MHQENWIDISFESFNQCGGSCPACNLTLAERNSEQFNLDDIKYAVKLLKEKVWTPHHRLILTYGDYPLLKNLNDLTTFLKNENIEFGFTGTFVLPSSNYDSFFKNHSILGFSLLDVIVDPFRLQTSQHYLDNLQNVVNTIPHNKLRLNILMSKALLDKHSPESLADLMVQYFGNIIAVPNALPTIFAIEEKKGAKFDILETLEWLKRYYKKHPYGYEHLQNELYENYQSNGTFLDFIQQTYHLDSKLNIYAVSDTIIGDFIYDRKNNFQPLHNLANIHSWDDVIQSQLSQKLNIISSLQIDLNSECESCVFQNSCKFFGVGNLMKTYSKYSNKSDYCYGPKIFELKNI
jgi:hypothetical protein